MKEDVYTKYGEGDPEVNARDEAMEKAMPTAEKMVNEIKQAHEYFRRTSPDAPVSTQPLNVDLRAFEAARQIWQSARNPYIATNDASHPNNWTRIQITHMAGIIQNCMGMPIYDLKT